MNIERRIFIKAIEQRPKSSNFEILNDPLQMFQDPFSDFNAAKIKLKENLLELQFKFGLTLEERWYIYNFCSIVGVEITEKDIKFEEIMEEVKKEDATITKSIFNFVPSDKTADCVFETENFDEMQNICIEITYAFGKGFKKKIDVEKFKKQDIIVKIEAMKMFIEQISDNFGFNLKIEDFKMGDDYCLSLLIKTATILLYMICNSFFYDNFDPKMDLVSIPNMTDICNYINTENAESITKHLKIFAKQIKIKRKIGE